MKDFFNKAVTFAKENVTLILVAVGVVVVLSTGVLKKIFK